MAAAVRRPAHIVLWAAMLALIYNKKGAVFTRPGLFSFNQNFEAYSSSSASTAFRSSSRLISFSVTVASSNA
jgi:hypothetical protein